MQSNLPVRTNQALLEHAGRNAVGLQQIKGRRVKRRGTQILCRLGIGFEQQHGDTALGKQQRQTKTDRSGADNGHFRVEMRHFSRRA